MLWNRARRSWSSGRVWWLLQPAIDVTGMRTRARQRDHFSIARHRSRADLAASGALKRVVGRLFVAGPRTENRTQFPHDENRQESKNDRRHVKGVVHDLGLWLRLTKMAEEPSRTSYRSSSHLAVITDFLCNCQRGRQAGAASASRVFASPCLPHHPCYPAPRPDARGGSRTPAAGNFEGRRAIWRTRAATAPTTISCLS